MITNLDAPCSQSIPLFTKTSMDQDTGLMTGVFDYSLRQFLLELVDECTISKLEALLMRR